MTKFKTKSEQEFYPYPMRMFDYSKPVPFIVSYHNALEVINHCCFSGKASFQDVRVLTVGDSTGDATTFLAKQLLSLGGEVVYIDNSESAAEIAKKRASFANLKNITWHQVALEEFASLDLEPFDYISCSNVSYFSKDFPEVLALLKPLLKEGGALQCSIDSRYGQAGMEQMRALVNVLEKKTDEVQEKIRDCRDLFNMNLNNWYNRCKGYYQEDIEDPSDAGIYHRFFRAKQPGYSVLDIYDAVNKANMCFNTFIPSSGIRLPYYEPSFYTNDEELLERFKLFDTPHRQAIAEIMVGIIQWHTFYLSNKPVHAPSPYDLDNIISLAPNFGAKSDTGILADGVAQNKLEQPYMQVTHPVRKTVSVAFERCRLTEHVLRYLDGQSTTAEVIQRVCNAISEDSEQIRQAILEHIVQIYQAFAVYQGMLIRHASVRHLSFDLSVPNLI